MANRTVALLSTLFNFAIAPLRWIETNPTVGLVLNRETKRRRISSDHFPFIHVERDLIYGNEDLQGARDWQTLRFWGLIEALDMKEAQRAYEAVSNRRSQLFLESHSEQAAARIVSKRDAIVRDAILKIIPDAQKIIIL